MEEAQQAAASEAAPKKTAPAMKVRKRRLSYTRVACDECQRRKTKCTGEKPCKSCRDSNQICLYDRTTRFRSRQRTSSTNAPSSADRVSQASVGSRSQLRQSRSQYDLNGQSPTAHRLPVSDYYLHLAEKLLTAPPPPQDQTEGNLRSYSHVKAKTNVLEQLILCHNDKSQPPGTALTIIDMKHWREIIALYEDEIGLQYPFLDLGRLIPTIEDIQQQKGRIGAVDTSQTAPKPLLTHGQAEDIAIMMLAIVSIFADGNTVKFSSPWVEALYSKIFVQTQLETILELPDLWLLILGNIFMFLSDRELLAWRGIGLVLRLLQEKFSQNTEDLSLLNSQSTSQAEKLYWTVYTLDRRWSFGTGLPFSVHDLEIDRQPALKDDTFSTAYLIHMVAFCRISSDVRKWLLEPSSSITVDATRDFLDFRVIQWKRNLPQKLRFRGIEDMFEARKEKRGEYRIRLTLYLRANQMRIIIHRKLMALSSSNGFSPGTTSILTDIAQDTIQTLVRLGKETDIYHAQHKTFNHFLESALSAILVVLSSIGDLVKRASCFNDAFAAMELIRRLSVSSPVSQKLREKLRNIEDVMTSIRDQSCMIPSVSEPVVDVFASPAQSTSAHSAASRHDGGLVNTFEQHMTSNLGEEASKLKATSNTILTEKSTPPNHGDQQRFGLAGISFDQNPVAASQASADSFTASEINAPFNRQTSITDLQATSETGPDLGSSNTALFPWDDLSFLNFPEIEEFLNEYGTGLTF